MTGSAPTTAVGGTPTDPSPTPRRVARPRWADPRIVVGLLLVLGSVLLGAHVVSSARSGYSLVAVVRDLAAGTVLTEDQLTVVQVRLPEHGRDAYVQTTAAAAGRTLSRDVSAGELLPSAAVVRAPAATTIVVNLAAGAAPQLRAGQRITLWLSSRTCPSVVLVPEVIVQGVSAGDGGAFGGGSGQTAVVALDPSAASRVVSALSSQGVTVRAGVLTGAAGPSGGVQDLSPCLGGT